MSGHSKWATIKHKKGVTDARRGKLFTKIIKEITVAARLGGKDIDSNPRLRIAVQNAKAENMPKENIERAIKKGIGELEGSHYEEVSYEGYGPAGVAVMLDILTDNKNRTVAEIRHIFSKHGGNLGEAGCVSWMFKKKGLITVDKKDIDEDSLMEIVLNNGGEDMVVSQNIYEITTPVEHFEQVKDAIIKKGIKIGLAEVSMISQSTVTIDEKQAEQIIKFMETLEDHDDVQKTYANFDIPEAIMERLKG